MTFVKVTLEQLEAAEELLKLSRHFSTMVLLSVSVWTAAVKACAGPAGIDNAEATNNAAEKKAAKGKIFEIMFAPRKMYPSEEGQRKL